MDVADALRRQNVELPAGRLESEQRDFTVRVERGYESVAEDFERPGDRAGARKGT